MPPFYESSTFSSASRRCCCLCSFNVLLGVKLRASAYEALPRRSGSAAGDGEAPRRSSDPVQTPNRWRRFLKSTSSTWPQSRSLYSPRTRHPSAWKQIHRRSNQQQLHNSHFACRLRTKDIKEHDFLLLLFLLLSAYIVTIKRRMTPFTLARGQ